MPICGSSVTDKDMTMTFDHLPLADAGREAHALELFHLEMTPEEYAARFGHEFALFSFDEFRYSRPGLAEWVQRLGDIFFKREGAPPFESCGINSSRRRRSKQPNGTSETRSKVSRFSD